MRILSKIYDGRIKAYSALFEFSVSQYLEIAKAILQNNNFQRRRVKSSSSVYSLLREDLKAGCTIPPLVLALSNDNLQITPSSSDESDEEIVTQVSSNVERLVILDGLQRTYTLIDVERELQQKRDEEILQSFYSHKLRLEIYLGINKLGILYRMLTLNTGQSPMSLRHQVEILYSDYLNHNVQGIYLLREVDESRPSQLGEYNFNDIVNGFTSYILRDESTIDRSDLLENIKSLEKLALENQDRDLFQNYLSSYHKLVLRMNELSNGWLFNEEDSGIELSGRAFGASAIKIFTRPQIMTGFGAAVGYLRDKELVDSFEDISKKIDEIHHEDDAETAFNNLVIKLDEIRKKAKKIGNAQRMYFYYLFRELFNEMGDAFLVLDQAIEAAYKRYLLNE